MNDSLSGWERMLAAERAKNERLRTTLHTVVTRISGTVAARWEPLGPEAPAYTAPNAAARYPGTLETYIRSVLDEGRMRAPTGVRGRPVVRGPFWAGLLISLGTAAAGFCGAALAFGDLPDAAAVALLIGVGGGFVAGWHAFRSCAHD